MSVADQRPQPVRNLIRDGAHQVGIALAGGRTQRGPAVFAREEDDLGQLAAEGLQGELEQVAQRVAHVLTARERAGGAVQELEALMLLALGHIGAIGGEERDGRNGEQPGRAWIAGDHCRACEAEARVRDRHHERDAEHLQQAAGAHRRLRKGDCRADEQNAYRAAEEGAGEGRAPGRRSEPRVRGYEQMERRGGDARREGVLPDVEHEPDQRAARAEGQHEPGADDLRDHQLRRARQEQPDHERELAKRHRVRAAAEVHVNDEHLGGGKGGCERPPRNRVAHRQRRLSAEDQEVEAKGSADDRGVQHPDGKDAAEPATPPALRLLFVVSRHPDLSSPR